MEEDIVTRLKEGKHDKVLNVYEIFKDYYGEAFVDLQGFDLESDTVTSTSGYILVWWPTVKVTNENDKYVYISHLYAKVPINKEGKMIYSFQLNRAEYPVEHILNRYLHSHISSVPIDDFSRFQDPCLGRGPIRDTINSLLREYDEDLWKLFVFELDKFVSTESLSGVPYHKLESVGSPALAKLTTLQPVPQFSFSGNYVIPTNMKKAILTDFLTHLIKEKKLRFNYSNGTYSIGMPFIETVLTISNCFIEWYNKNYDKYKISLDKLINSRILKKCIIANNAIIQTDSYYNSRIAEVQRYEGRTVCTFKGKIITVHIINSNKEDTERNQALILNDTIISFMFYAILNVLNSKYGRENKNKYSTNPITRYI